MTIIGKGRLLPAPKIINNLNKIGEDCISNEESVSRQILSITNKVCNIAYVSDWATKENITNSQFHNFVRKCTYGSQIRFVYVSLSFPNCLVVNFLGENDSCVSKVLSYLSKLGTRFKNEN